MNVKEIRRGKTENQLKQTLTKFINLYLLTMNTRSTPEYSSYKNIFQSRNKEKKMEISIFSFKDEDPQEDEIDLEVISHDFPEEKGGDDDDDDDGNNEEEKAKKWEQETKFFSSSFEVTLYGMLKPFSKKQKTNRV
jgi:hypothetical protein